MRPREVETWALRVLDQIDRHEPYEMSLIELKADWIEPQKAARRIAGHANSARGNDILWLIGVDEQTGVCGANPANLANWFPEVRSHFETVTPEMTDVIVEWQGKQVIALAFQSDRAPFVVKNPTFGQKGGGPLRYEVPWRQGTSVDTATRSQLLLLLSPTLQLPDLEHIESDLVVVNSNIRGVTAVEWLLSMKLYVTPRSPQRIAFASHRVQPSHQVDGTTDIVGYDGEIVMWPLGWKNGGFKPFTQPDSLHPTIQTTNYDLTIDGPGAIQINAKTNVLGTVTDREAHRIVSMKIRPAGIDFAITVSARLTFTPTPDLPDRWISRSR